MNHFPQTPERPSLSSTGSPNALFHTPKSDMNSPYGRRTSGGGRHQACAQITKGDRPVCLVNASFTVIPGDKEIYAFGGFDQYTDEVYNHVLRLDLKSYVWQLVDNYGDIPCVRMGHTTNYWKDGKLISFGGENDSRIHLADVFLFDLKTAHWTKPHIEGTPPIGRSRHAACLHDDKLWICGGVCGRQSGHEILDDICYLDLNTWTWSRSWKFVARFDHQCWVSGDKLWVFGGLTPHMDRTGELLWIDIKDTPAFAGSSGSGAANAITYGTPRAGRGHVHGSEKRGSGMKRLPANAGQIRFRPGAGGETVPQESVGAHFHHVINNQLIDFVTPAPTIPAENTCISALDLGSLTWRTMARGAETFGGEGYRWYYLGISPTSTMAYLIGSVPESEGPDSEQLSVVLPIDLTHFGILPPAKAHAPPSRGTMGGDLSVLFLAAQDPNSDVKGDFVIYGLKDEACEGDDNEGLWTNLHSEPASPSPSPSHTPINLPPTPVRSPPIHAHKLILFARWPHFGTMLSNRMAEFHSNTLYLPEPYSVLTSFIHYLYSDSLPIQATSPSTPSPAAGLLPLSNLYSLPRLRAQCIARISSELSIDSAAYIWSRARIAGEDQVRKHAASFCMRNWGRVVRSRGFRKLGKKALWELCGEVDLEGMVVRGNDDDDGVDADSDDEVRGFEDDGDDDADGMEGVVDG